MEDNIKWKLKYTKYKTKYLELKQNQMIGGKINKKNCVKIIFVRHGESTQNVAGEKGESYDAKNIVLTDKGIEQAKKTGTYLSKTFGKFDKVYSSPVTRCVQTSNIIMEQIGFEPEFIQIDELLVEIGYYKDKLEGMSKEQIDKSMISNKKISKLEEKIKKTFNPYEKILLLNKFGYEYDKFFELKPSLQEAKTNCEIFLEKLKDLNDCEQILVVTHGGIIGLIQKIVCNIDVENNILFSKKKFDSVKELGGNCTILCLCLTDNCIKMISPANTYHLDT